jgi:hypothetical protein
VSTGRPNANGASNSTSPPIGTPIDAASRARIAPDENPNTVAGPSHNEASAARSSTSRSIAYGAVSPLSPRPRLSYRITVWSVASADARSAHLV